MKNSYLRPTSTRLQIGRVLRSVHVAPDGLGAAAPAAASPADSAVKTAAQQAYEKGLAAGREEGRREFASATAALAKLTTGLKQEAAELKQKSDQAATVLAMRIAAKIVGREVKSAETVQRMIGAALTQVPLGTGLSVRLNPQDFTVLEPLRSKMQELGVELPEDVAVVSDASISRGGCVVEGRLGQVDARVETQMAFIERALLGDEPRQE